MANRSLTRLPLLGPGDSLTGVAPVAFERVSKVCRVGDHQHRGLLRIATLVCRHGLRRVVAPSARHTLDRGLFVTEGWTQETLNLKRVQVQRSECFTRLPEIEELTLEALRASLSRAAQPVLHGLAAHAESVVWRYVRLATRLAAEAVLLTLDGVTEPSNLASVVQQVAAARAYQGVGLGAARQPDLVAHAEQQAQREAERELAQGHAGDLLSLQIFHEYLGVRWKVLHDAERAYIDQFVNWAIGGRAGSTIEHSRARPL